VVIAIIGVLVALLLPAVQSARESARRMQCQNHMKQVALAAQNFHDSHLHFPHGVYEYIDTTTSDGPPPYYAMQDRRCWAHDLLPYIEQKPLYDEFDAWMAKGKSALGFPLMQTPIKVYVCPSDPYSPKFRTYWGGSDGQPHQGFSGNLITLATSTYFNPSGPASSVDLDGIFFSVSKVRIAEVIDGTSNTLMVSETILSPDIVWHDIRGRYYNPGHGGVLFSTRLPPNTMVADQFNWCNPEPVKRAPCINTTTEMFILPRSYHPGGVDVAMVDGSVRFCRETISQPVFQGFGSRNGGETGSLD
jgi:prepilin-type processing-associated H-X9-DG protein